MYSKNKNPDAKKTKKYYVNFSTMFYKVVSETIYSSKETTTPIILNAPHHIKHR